MPCKHIFSTLKNVSAVLIISISLNAMAGVKVDFNNLPYVEDYWTLPAKEIEERAKAGDPFTQKMMEFFYALGSNGYPQDKAQAQHWQGKATAGFKQLADNGNAQAQYRMGAIYLQKETRDTGSALAYLTHAAEQGHVLAQFELGKLYLQEEMRNRDLSEHWFKKALPQIQQKAQEGDRSAMGMLYSMYEDGFGGLEKNEAQAFALEVKEMQARRKMFASLESHAFNPIAALGLLLHYNKLYDQNKERPEINEKYLLKMSVLAALIENNIQDVPHKELAGKISNTASANSSVDLKKLEDATHQCLKKLTDECY